MKYQMSAPINHSRTGIVILLGVLVAGCVGVVCVGSLIVLFYFGYFGAPSNSPAVGIGLPSNSRAWNFYLLGISASSSQQEGWKDVSIDLAVENMSHNPAWFPEEISSRYSSPHTVLIDTGGYIRAVDSVHPSYPRDQRDHVYGFMLWPNFRAIFTLASRIPQNQSSVTLKLDMSGDEYIVDLTKPPTGIKTPFEQPPTGWQPKQLGDTTEIPKVARIALTDVELTDGKPPDSSELGKAVLRMVIDAENLGGKDIQVTDFLPKIYAFDDHGRLGDDLGRNCGSSRASVK